MNLSVSCFRWSGGRLQRYTILLTVTHVFGKKVLPPPNVVRVAFGECYTAAIYEVATGLPNDHLYHRYEVLCDELIDYEVLFGMDIVTETDFLITNKDGKTTFRFRTPSGAAWIYNRGIMTSGGRGAMIALWLPCIWLQIQIYLFQSACEDFTIFQCPVFV